MKVVVLSALGNEMASRCLQSMLQTAPTADFDLHLIRERDFRERTLNAALETVGAREDILFVGDDIEFTPGWYEALQRHYDEAEILGMSMLEPGTTTIQDRGYDLALVDDRITLMPRDRGLDRSEVSGFGFRSCDAVTGCFMLVKATVFAQIPRFSEEGQNRWGEFIFTAQARRKGARVAVLDHYLFHGGKSTKANPNLQLRSTSYQVERSLWDQIVARYVDPAEIRLHLSRSLHPTFRKRLELGSGRVLFYGIGTVTEFILQAMQPAPARVAFCTGLAEEAGRPYYGQRVRHVEEVDLAAFDWILITPLHRGERIFREAIAGRLPPDFAGTVSAVEWDPVTAEYTVQDLLN